MCGRFLLHAPVDTLQRAFGFAERPNLRPRYNVAPTQTVPVVRRSHRDGGGRELALARWGLIPSWAKDASIGNKLINARAETVAEKPAFRGAFRERRALVPADGFYEWRKREGGGPKQPLLIRRRDGEPFAFAGLWEHWRGPEGEVETCTILTTEANAALAPIHDRMPVILDPASYDRWLDPAQPRAEELLQPCPDEWLEAFPVSTRVNNVRNDVVELIAPMNPA
jgi:putative SOS response-associated peptidase YedK